MAEWMKVGTDVVVGGGAGAIDQLLQNQDNKRMAEKPGLSMMSQYGTYYNYGVPILAILGSAFGFLKGTWATRFIVAGSQLAGRKVALKVTKGGAVSYTRWSPSHRSKEVRGQVGGAVSPVGIPIVADETVLV